MGAQIPAIPEKPLATRGCRKFQLDPLGDHLNTCTTHSGAKKAHDWMVDQLADLSRTTHKVKTQQVDKNRGHHCGDIELAGYLANSSIRPWAGWDRSGLNVEMKPGLLASGRRFSQLPWGLRSQLFQKSH